MIVIKIILLGWFISDFSPLKNILLKVKKNIITDIILKVISCQKCTTLWVGIIYWCFNPISIFIPLLASYIAFFLSNQKIKL